MTVFRMYMNNLGTRLLFQPIWILCLRQSTILNIWRDRIWMFALSSATGASAYCGDVVLMLLHGAVFHGQGHCRGVKVFHDWFHVYNGNVCLGEWRSICLILCTTTNNNNNNNNNKDLTVSKVGRRKTRSMHRTMYSQQAKVTTTCLKTIVVIDQPLGLHGDFNLGHTYNSDQTAWITRPEETSLQNTHKFPEWLRPHSKNPMSFFRCSVVDLTHFR